MAEFEFLPLEPPDFYEPDLKEMFDQLVKESALSPPDLLIDWPSKEGWAKEAYEAAVAGLIGFRLTVRDADG